MKSEDVRPMRYPFDTEPGTLAQGIEESTSHTDGLSETIQESLREMESDRRVGPGMKQPASEELPRLAHFLDYCLGPCQDRTRPGTEILVERDVNGVEQSSVLRRRNTRIG